EPEIDPRQQRALVRCAEGGDRPLTHRRWHSVDQPIAHRHRGVTKAPVDGGDQVRDGKTERARDETGECRDLGRGQRLGAGRRMIVRGAHVVAAGGDPHIASVPERSINFGTELLSFSKLSGAPPTRDHGGPTLSSWRPVRGCSSSTISPSFARSSVATSNATASASTRPRPGRRRLPGWPTTGPTSSCSTSCCRRWTGWPCSATSAPRATYPSSCSPRGPTRSTGSSVSSWAPTTTS